MKKINVYLLPTGDIQFIGTSGSKRKTKFSPSAVTVKKERDWSKVFDTNSFLGQRHLSPIKRKSVPI